MSDRQLELIIDRMDVMTALLDQLIEILKEWHANE